jgi:hypothetical protein
LRILHTPYYFTGPNIFLSIFLYLFYPTLLSLAVNSIRIVCFYSLLCSSFFLYNSICLYVSEAYSHAVTKWPWIQLLISHPDSSHHLTLILIMLHEQ